MKSWNVGVNNNSFDSAGITKDCQEAVCELIRNGFEAQASKVEVCLEGGNLMESPVLIIKDNGTGINHETLEQTFGKFLSSEKRGIGVQIKSQANKGIGRFAFSALSHEAKWITRYKANNHLFQYTLQLNTNDMASVLESDEITDVTNLGWLKPGKCIPTLKMSLPRFSDSILPRIGKCWKTVFRGS